MTFSAIFVSLAVLSLLLLTSADRLQGAPSYLWRLERANGGPPVHMFGTVHAPYTAVWPHVPDNSKAALSASDRLVFELDFTDPGTLRRLERCQLIGEDADAGGEGDVGIPPPMRARLEAYMARARHLVAGWMSDEQRRQVGGLRSRDWVFESITGGWRGKKAVWVELTLHALNRWDVPLHHLPWLDLYLARRALDRGRRTAAIERVEEQCRTLDRLDPRLVIHALNATLTSLERDGEDQDGGMMAREAEKRRRIVEKYNSLRLRASDLLDDDDQADEERRAIGEYFRLNMNVRRNHVMASRIDRMLRDRSSSGERITFVFGVGHFIGDDSIIEIMTRRLGYAVTRVDAEYRRHGSNSNNSNSDHRWWWTTPNDPEEEGRRDPRVTERSEEEWRRYIFSDSSSTSHPIPSSFLLLLLLIIQLLV